MAIFDKTYELPLSRDYVRHWGVAEAVRELLQNALDNGNSPMEYSWDRDQLRITSRHARLEPKTLLLGSTSKADAKDKIGSFGEGYKIALLVLTREGKQVRIVNNEVMWQPEFRMSKQFGEEVLTICETKHPEGRGQGVTFLINNLSNQDKENIIERTLQMQQSIGPVIDTSKGQILRHKPGRLYVNGLFVCDTEHKFGYNMKPEYLKLERDRQTVSSFDLSFLTKNMWFESGLNEEIAQMMADKVPDLEYAQYGTPEIVKEACYQHFREMYPDHILASSDKELKTLVKNGMTRVTYVGNDNYTAVVKSSKSYQSAAPQVAIQTPRQHLEAWLRDNRSNMRTQAIVAFKDVIAKADDWKVS